MSAADQSPRFEIKEHESMLTPEQARLPVSMAVLEETIFGLTDLLIEMKRMVEAEARKRVDEIGRLRQRAAVLERRQALLEKALKNGL